MLRKENGYLKLYPWMVKYTQHGKTVEQWALPSKEWWTDFADKWEHTEIVEFVEVELTNEQLARAEEIEQLRIDEGYRDICIDYILHSQFPEGPDHPLRQLQVQENPEPTEQEIVNAELLLGQAQLLKSQAAIEETVALILLETIGGVLYV